MTRDEIIVAVRRIVEADGTEEELDDLIDQVSAAVPHPSWTDLVYYDDRGRSVEQVVDEALAYRPVHM